MIYLPGVAGYAEAAKALAAEGLSVADVVHVAEYAGGAGDAAGRVAFLDGHEAPVSRIPIEASFDAGPVVVALTAVPGGGALTRAGQDVLRRAEGTVFLPSVWTTEGEFRDQYRWCLIRLGELLSAAGLGLDALVQTTDYTATATRSDYPRCGRPRKELLGRARPERGVSASEPRSPGRTQPGPERGVSASEPRSPGRTELSADGAVVFPGSAGILVDVPIEAGAMVALDAVAADGPLTTVNPGWARYDTLTYRPAVLAGRTLHMSGFGALDPVSQLALFPGDLRAQAEYMYASIGEVLRVVGATGAEVVRLVEYVTPDGREAYPGLADLRREHFPNAAVTSVVCSALLRPEFLLETVPTAVLR